MVHRYRCRGCGTYCCKHRSGLLRTESSGEETALCEDCRARRVKANESRRLRLGGWTK
jgi:hypothetical protein